MLMLEQVTLKDLIDLGTSGMLVFFLWKVWDRLNEVTDVVLKDRYQAAVEREIIAEANGVSRDELRARVNIMKQSGHDIAR
jgi:hypothetical protein